MRNRGRSCAPKSTPMQADGRWPASSVVTSMARAPGRPPSLKPPLGACCKDRFSAHRRPPEAKEVRNRGPELRPQVDPDAGRWAMASFFGGYLHGANSRPTPLSKTPNTVSGAKAGCPKVKGHRLQLRRAFPKAARIGPSSLFSGEKGSHFGYAPAPYCPVGALYRVKTAVRSGSKASVSELL